MHISTAFSRNSSVISTYFKNCEATDYKASPGHYENQSIVQQLTSEGKLRILFLKASPIGENAITECKSFLHLSTKYEYNY